MEIPVFQVDAFASEPFKGNPAAVCLLDEPRPAEWMQNVAMEMNLSETAFILPRADGPSLPAAFDLRWFTPTVEVPLCGHATLASAHTLWESGRVSGDKAVRFSTLSGWLITSRRDDRIEMDFPAILSDTHQLPGSLAGALGLASREVICNRVRGKGGGDFLLELESEETVRNLEPNFELLGRNVDSGVIVTAQGDSSKYDFVSRYFACHVGIDEDPVTGAAHCILTPYWSAKLGKTEMFAYQASPRGGEVNVRLSGERVLLGGRAVTIWRGNLLY
jgi:PhzF family phenazine biosynthesis protein